MLQHQLTRLTLFMKAHLMINFTCGKRKLLVLVELILRLKSMP